MHRIIVVSAALLGGAGVVAVGAACAQAYPNRPIRMVVALAAGGSSDAVARVVALRLSHELGQQVITDNRPGAGGSVGGDIAAHAPADGYTLFFGGNGVIAISPNLLKLRYSIPRDLAPISMTGASPFLLMTYPALPVKSMAELLALARARPGKVNYGTSGQGSTGHLGWELLKAVAKVNITHVPFRGSGPALTSILSGEIDAVMFGVSASLPYVKQNQLRGLAVSSAARLPVLPDTPTIAETLPNFEVSTWYGLLTTAGTPPAIIDQLYQATARALKSKEAVDRLAAVGVDPETMPPDRFTVRIAEETARWGKLVKSIGLKAE